MAISYVKNVGTNGSVSTTATTLAVTVPAGGVPVGDLLTVRFCSNTYTVAGTVSCADTRGNTYQTDFSRINTADGINILFSSLVTVALLAGDTITVTFPAGDQPYALSVDEFTGIASAGWRWQVDATGVQGSNLTPSDTITPAANPPVYTLVLGALFDNTYSTDGFTEDTTHTAGGDSWHSLTPGFAPNAAAGVRAAYKLPTTGNTGVAQTWSPTYPTTHYWIESLVIYQGTTTPVTVKDVATGTYSGAPTSTLVVVSTAVTVTDVATGTYTGAPSSTLLPGAPVTVADVSTGTYSGAPPALIGLTVTSDVTAGTYSGNPSSTLSGAGLPLGGLPGAAWPLVCINGDFTQGPPNITGAKAMSLDAPIRRNVVRQWDTKRGRQYELNQVAAGTANLTITDPLEYLNPGNTASPFMTNGNAIKPYRPMQIGAFWNPATGNVTGNILNSSNAAPGQPTLGTNYGYDPAFETWNLTGTQLSTDGAAATAVSTLPSTPLNSNTTFETGLSPWTVTGGSMVLSSTQKHGGTYAAQITPNGTATQNYISSEQVPVTAGNAYCSNMWVWFTNAVTNTISASVNWFNASHGYLTTSTVNVSVAAGTWTQLQNTFTAPANAAYAAFVPTLAGTPAASQIWYVDDASLTNATNPANSGYTVTKVTAPTSSSYVGWVPRIGPGTYTLSVDVYAPTGTTVTAAYGATTAATTVTGQYQTVSLVVTATNSTVWQLKATAASPYPATFYLANVRVQGTMPGWSQTSGSAMAYTPAQARSGTYSCGTTVQAGADTMTLPVPTAPGIVYTMSAWVYAPTGSSVRMALAGNSTTSSATNAWQQLAVTFQATDAVTPVTWSAPTGAYPVAFFLDDVQLEAAVNASANTTSGPTWYPIYSGYIERYPLAYSMSGTRGMRPLNAVDGLAILSRTQINQSVRKTILADNPYMYMPLNDQSLPQQIIQPQGGQPTQGYQNLGTQGTVNFQGDSFLDGVSAVSITQQNTTNPVTRGNNAYVTYLGTTVGMFTMNTAAFTVSTWVKFVAGSVVFGAGSLGVNENPNFAFAGPNHYGGWGTQLGAAFPGRLQVNWADPFITSNLWTPFGPNAPWNGWPDGKWHHLALTFIGNSSVQNYVDGVPDGPPSTIQTAPTPFVLVNNFFMDLSTYSGDPISTAAFANFAAFPYALNASQVAAHYSRGTGYINELPGARVARLLGQYWKGGQIVAPGILKLAPDHGYNGRMMLDVLQEIQESERGLVYVDRSGNVVFEDRGTRYNSQSPLWVFGENPAGASPAEYPYQNYVGDFDPTYTFSQANLTRPGNGNYPPRVNAQAQADFGQRILTQTLQANTDFDLQQAGIFYTSRYAAPKVRIQTITLNPAANPALWPLVLSLEISQRVTVKRRSGGLTTSNDYYIESIAHKVNADAGTWTVDLEMSPVFVPTAWVLGDPTYGVLGSTTVPIY